MPKFKPVMVYDETQRKLRLFRVIWDHGTVGDGQGYSNKVAVSLVPRLFGLLRDWDGWRLTIAGLQVHRLKSWGGRFA